MTDPLIPPWEMCKTCGGDHWTKDHPVTNDASETVSYPSPGESAGFDAEVDVIAAALNATQIQPSELQLGRDLRPVARRLLAALPPSLESLLAEATKFVMEEYSGPLTRWFDHGRIRIVGPWQFRDGIQWQAIADPYNATGHGFDIEIEGVGSTPEEALQELIRKFHEQEVKAK